MQRNMISAEIEATPNQASKAAIALQRLGFRVLHIGTTISVEGPQSLWETTFNVSFEARRKAIIEGVGGGEVVYQKAITENMRIPPELRDHIKEVMFVEPPEFY